MADALLPFTNEWQIARDVHNSVYLRHATDSDGTVRYNTCELSVLVKRNYLVFLVKNLLISMVVVFGSLVTALFMHPEDLVGDRFAVLFIGFLILVTNMQTDLGLGAVTQLLWIDWFNIVQIILILVAVAESVIVHILLKTQHDKLGISIDRVMRYTIPFVLYVIVTSATIIQGLEQYYLCPDTDLCGIAPQDPRFTEIYERTGRVSLATTGRLMAWIGMILTTVGSFVSVFMRTRQVQLEQLRSVANLVRIAMDEPASKSSKSVQSLVRKEYEDEVKMHASMWEEATERVFRVYDLDDSGGVDFKELRGVVCQMYPLAPAGLVRNAIMPLRQFADGDGDLDLASFQDAIAVLMEYMAREEMKGNESAQALWEEAVPDGFLGLFRTTFQKTFRESATKSRNSTAFKATKVRKHLRKSAYFNAFGGKGMAKDHVASAPQAADQSKAQSQKPEKACRVSVPNIRAFANEAVASVLEISANAPPYDPSLPSVCIIRTANGGSNLGNVSGSNLPDGHVWNASIFAADAIAKLVGIGFTLASATTDKPELMFTLLREGDAKEKPQTATRMHNDGGLVADSSSGSVRSPQSIWLESKVAECDVGEDDPPIANSEPK